MITMKDIIKEGHPNLKKVSRQVKVPLSNSDKILAKNLLSFVINSQDNKIREKYNLTESVGIAAPQVNILKRMFAIYVKDFNETMFNYVVINPIINSKSKDIIYLDEGEDCLSVPKKRNGLIVKRSLLINVSFTLYDPFNDTYKNVENLEIEGYPAIVFQHEYDHLDGILYIDKTTKLDSLNDFISLKEYIEEKYHFN